MNATTTKGNAMTNDERNKALEAQRAATVESFRNDMREMRADNYFTVALTNQIGDMMIDRVRLYTAREFESCGLPSVQTAYNAYIYAPRDKHYRTNREAIIEGCFAYMRNGADDSADIIETAKVLAFLRPNL